jgi:hypothetical protein
MDRRGRKTAVTVAVLLGCFIGGTVLWIGNGDGREVKLMAAASIFLPSPYRWAGISDVNTTRSNAKPQKTGLPA